MANVPLTTRFIGISESVNLEEKKSSVLNAEAQPFTMQDIVDTVGGAGSRLSFIAKITQSGTSNPSVDVYENTAEFSTPYFVRQDIGTYTMDLPAGYTANKVSVSINNGMFTPDTFINFDEVFGKINILTLSLGVPSDDVLVYGTVEVKLFN